MRPVSIAVLAAALALMTGCAGMVSLHPLVSDSDKDAYFEPALLGMWREASPDNKAESANGEVYTVTRDGGNGYKMTVTEDGAQKTVGFRLLKLEGRYLVDVRDDLGDPALPVHVYFGLVMEKDTLKVSEMDTPWLKERVAERKELRGEELTEADVKGKVVLAAGEADLRKYFLPLAADNRSFANESELRRVK